MYGCTRVEGHACKPRSDVAAALPAGEAEHVRAIQSSYEVLFCIHTLEAQQNSPLSPHCQELFAVAKNSFGAFCRWIQKNTSVELMAEALLDPAGLASAAGPLPLATSFTSLYKHGRFRHCKSWYETTQVCGSGRMPQARVVLYHESQLRSQPTRFRSCVKWGSAPRGSWCGAVRPVRDLPMRGDCFDRKVSCVKLEGKV